MKNLETDNDNVPSIADNAPGGHDAEEGLRHAGDGGAVQEVHREGQVGHQDARPQNGRRRRDRRRWRQPRRRAGGGGAAEDAAQREGAEDRDHGTRERTCQLALVPSVPRFARDERFEMLVKSQKYRVGEINASQEKEGN